MVGHTMLYHSIPCHTMLCNAMQCLLCYACRCCCSYCCNTGADGDDNTELPLASRVFQRDSELAIGSCLGVAAPVKEETSELAPCTPTRHPEYWNLPNTGTRAGGQSDESATQVVELADVDAIVPDFRVSSSGSRSICSGPTTKSIGMRLITSRT